MWWMFHLGYTQKILAAIIKYASARDEASDYTLKTLEEDGACLAKCVMKKYKELITSKYVHK